MTDSNDDDQRVFSPVGERGPGGDVGPSGNAGERGMTGEIGATGAAGETGARGFTGVGERGPAGDVGSSGHDGRRGLTGLSGEPGVQGAPGINGIPVVHVKSKTAQILLSIGILFLGLSLVLAQLYARFEVEDVKDQISEINKNRIRFQIIEECDNLYQDDLRQAQAQSIVSLSTLVVAVFGRPGGLTDKESTKLYQELSKELAKQNKPLQKAIDNNRRFERVDPPERLCPHPKAAADRELENLELLEED